MVVKIKSFRYNVISDSDARRLEELLSTVWGNGGGRRVHPEEMDAMSFYVVEGDVWVGYVGVVAWDIQAGGEGFRMGALSCVCTRASHRRQGIGTRLVREATEWMRRCGHFDVGLFTCAPGNVAFYEGIGSWEVCPDLVLRADDCEGAYASDRLGLRVFRWLISERARRCISFFSQAVLTLHLPEGQFV